MRITGLLTVVAVGSLLSCERRAPDVAERAIAWADSEPTCDFRRQQAHSDPQQLAHEFVTRSAAGEFSRSEDWLPGAVDCPGHEPGYDLFQVVAAYSSKPIYTGADTVRYELTLRRVGVMSNGFHREAGVEVDTFTLYRTPFGWRIVSPGPWAWITVEAAVSRGWLQFRDTVVSE